MKNGCAWDSILFPVKGSEAIAFVAEGHGLDAIALFANSLGNERGASLTDRCDRPQSIYDVED